MRPAERIGSGEITGTRMSISRYGGIPPELGSLSKLRTLWLNQNQLNGQIPPQLGNLGVLKRIDLSRNELDGFIPVALGRLSNLRELNLAHNQLTGPIPEVLGDLRELETLSLSGNNLTGPIPKALGRLSELKVLALRSNQLNGPIPSELGNLTVLERLELDRNELSGDIPEELGVLRKLKALGLNDNRLTGTIHEALGGLSELKVLALGSNQLIGRMPPQLGGLLALESLNVSSNNLSGCIPKEVGYLSNLEKLELEGNRLTGCLPKELAGLTKLKTLSLNNNRLTAFWDHTSDIASGEELQQDRAAGASVPKQLKKLLAWLLALERRYKLYIGNNPWKEPPEAVVRKGVPAASGYFADLYAGGTVVRLNMIKVVLVGQEGAGKTSLRQSMRSGRPTPTSGAEESTVQIDVEEMKMDVNGTSISLRVYDCGGQVAYTGLLQMFLSPRAVTLLACNAGAFGEQDVRSISGDLLKGDLHRLQELRVCDWLRSLSFRIPDSDVVVVATKCDLAGGMAANLAGRIESAVHKWVEDWSDCQMPAVRVEDGISLTSCVDSAQGERTDAVWGKSREPGESVWACDWLEDSRDGFPQGLLHRVMYNNAGNLRGAALVLPRSWEIALRVLDALGSGRDPVEWVHQMAVHRGVPVGRERAVSTEVGRDDGVPGITMAELLTEWNGAVKTLNRDGVEIDNPDHALEGALLIREHEGSLVRHERYVFLDVTWLVKILKPLLNHKDEEDPFSGSLSLGDTGITLDDFELISSWRRFKATGVLEPALAEALWGDGLSDYVLPTLASLGLAHPLDGGPAEGLVVLLRLGKERPSEVGKELDNFQREHAAVLSVTWKVFLGAPPGAIEKVLIRCCSIGTLRTFWRFGVLVVGSLGAVTLSKTFALLIEYSQETSEITMKIYGDMETAAPWTALSFGISALRSMCWEFPGLRWRASLRCPEHAQGMEISNAASQPGDKLLLQNTCSLCSSETGGLGAAATDLLEMVDVVRSKDEIFREMQGRFLDVQRRYSVLCPGGSRGLRAELNQLRFDTWLKSMQEEAETLLHVSERVTREDISEEEMNENAVGREAFSGVAHEMTKLQTLVGDLQQQLKNHRQDVRGWLGGVDNRLENVIDADAGVMEKQDFLVAMLKAVRSEGFDTPRQACILPPWKFAQAHGLSESEQSPEGWVRRLGEWRKDDFKQGKGFFTKKKRLFLVCAHTYRLVPCGPNGQGYDIHQSRTWVRMSCSVAAFALQVVCTTLAAMATAPLAGLGAAAEAGVSAAMDSFESILQDQVEGLVFGDDNASMGMSYQTAQLERGAYAALREFIHGIEDGARLEVAKGRRGSRGCPTSSEFVFFAQKMAQVQRHSGDAAVQWVLKEHVDAWYDAMGSARGAKVDVS
ncbi:unnamed protein product [Scytosiphon promiscuus]